MILALRALQYSYSSNCLGAGSAILFRDQWEVPRKRSGGVLPPPLARQGLGIARGMQEHGIGWFLPKIDWQVCHVSSEYTNQFLAGNLLRHQQFKKKARQVKELKDVWVRFEQANQWFIKHDLQKPGPKALDRQWQWLEYLICLVINQFDLDIFEAMLRNHTTNPELRGNCATIKALEQTRFCHTDMSAMFEDQAGGPPLPPHTSISNRSKITTAYQLLSFLLEEEDQGGVTRGAWQKLPFRLIYTHCLNCVGRHLGPRLQRQWQESLFFCLQLTHWILPYSVGPKFFSTTKRSRRTATGIRMCWFTSVYNEPDPEAEEVDGWPEGHPRTLQGILDEVARTLPPPLPQGWRVRRLVRECRVYGLTAARLKKHQRLGKEYSRQVKRWEPAWEQGTPPRLQIAQAIRHKTPEELEALFERLLSDIDEE